MPHPLLIGGLLVGGSLAAWRVTRPYRRRLKTIVDSIRLPGEKAADPIPLKQDPETGIYRPITEPHTERD